jgi:hypothetical protein
MRSSTDISSVSKEARSGSLSSLLPPYVDPNSDKYLVESVRVTAGRVAPPTESQTPMDRITMSRLKVSFKRPVPTIISGRKCSH